MIDASYAENIKRRMRVEAKLMEDVPGYEPMPTNYYHQNWTEPKNNDIWNQLTHACKLCDVNAMTC